MYDMEKLSFEQLPVAVCQLHEKLESIERLLLEKDFETPDKSDELLTVDQCAEFLHLSKPTIYGLISQGELPVMKRSKRCYFLRKELVEYLKAGRKKTNSEIREEADRITGTARDKQ